MTFQSRYQKLNAAQKQAVDRIDGPVMVVAGPGTGKTELLSMRAANILQKTDTLPQNILCLTFTESGADAMRERLASIIGADAYKVAIHTFHSFGSDIISRYSDYFYHGASFRPADEASTYEIVHGIFDELDYNNPLASQMNDEYTHLRDVTRAISELKKSGLTSDELLLILDDNERALDACERELAEIFATRISKTTKDRLAPIAMTIAELPDALLPPGIAPMAHTLSLSLSHAIDAAEQTGSTKPITAWKNTWLEKNEHGAFVFKDRRRHTKLRAVSYIYYQYLLRMQEQQLYDFDDMVLRTVHALEVFKDLRYNLQEQYQYIMVDEFQDTNLAQARLLHGLTHSDLATNEPNIMVVGDDDQAIYSFQGAEVSNILQFRDQYESVAIIPLVENYRSAAPILSQAREVIAQGSERLERLIEGLDKTLVPRSKAAPQPVTLHEHTQPSAERAWLAATIAADIASGTQPRDITVITRRHSELVELLPYFAARGIAVNYERRENVLRHPLVLQLVALGNLVHCLSHHDAAEADALLPELLAHPAWGVAPEQLWQLGLKARQTRTSWLETMATMSEFSALRDWLLTLATTVHTTPLEPMLDTLIGRVAAEEDGFTSPLFAHYFGADVREKHPADYLSFLAALRTLREKLREYQPNRQLTIADFLDFIELHERLGTPIMAVQPGASSGEEGRINLMTAHKSKGLEFAHVYIPGAIDSAWGERVRTRSRLISYPENLALAPAGDTLDERLRLFFVAMTRAKQRLTISYSLAKDNGSAAEPASFLATSAWQPQPATAPEPAELIAENETAWYQPLVELEPHTMKELLAPLLEDYKLSATHLGAFLDVTRGGPQHFLLSHLLRFPQSMSAHAAYGSAVHRTLQQTHAHLAATKKRRPLEDILSDFENNLAHMNMAEPDFEHFLRRGSDSLAAYFEAEYDRFAANTKAELNFASQHSRLGEARLTGSLDAVKIDTDSHTMVVTDFKTGKPTASWKGKDDYAKIKLHHYRQQLLFYKLLVEHSRDYSGFTVERGVLQFVEPTPAGQITSLEMTFDDPEEIARLSALIAAVWRSILQLHLPNTSGYSADYKGILAFEQDLLDSRS